MFINVTVLDESADCAPTNILEFKEWLESMISKIPEHNRKNARFEIGAYDSYGSPYSTIVIDYEREETQEEKAERERIDAVRSEYSRQSEIKRALAILEHNGHKF